MLTFSTLQKHGLATKPHRRSMSGVWSPQHPQVRQILRRSSVQPKLTIGAPNDKYEQEADRVADQVMRMHDPSGIEPTPSDPQIQRICEECEEEVRRQPIEEEEEEELLQAKRVSEKGISTLSPETQARIATVRQGGAPLPENTRNFFEPRFGQDFSGVRVHADALAADSANSVNARAYTLGRDIVFGSGQYAPGTSGGKQLLAHELTHVVQQQDQPHSLQRWSFGAGKAPHSDYSEVPADERTRVTAAMSIIEKVRDRPKDWPRCHNYYKDNCPSGTAGTFKQKVDNATIWFDKDDSVWGSGVNPDHIAYSAETWRWGRWTIAGVMIHEMMHRCGQDNETINDRAITTCGFPDIDKEKPIVKK